MQCIRLIEGFTDLIMKFCKGIGCLFKVIYRPLNSAWDRIKIEGWVLAPSLLVVETAIQCSWYHQCEATIPLTRNTYILYLEIDIDLFDSHEDRIRAKGSWATLSKRVSNCSFFIRLINLYSL